MVVAVLLCSQVIVITLTCWLAARVARLSKLASRATKRAPDPAKWELRLRELGDEVASLSSSYEKAQRLLLKLNSRAGMRELRSSPDASEPPPPGASKAELRRYYGFKQDGPEFARRQLSLVPRE